MSSRKKLLEEIYDQFLVCKICFDVYTRPKTLACLHTFCEDCIEKHQEAELERAYRYLLYASRTVTCPICRKKTELPPGGVRRLPDNIIVPRLVDIVCGGGRGVTSSRSVVAGTSSNARVTLTCEICKSVSPTSISSSSPRYAVPLSRDCTSPTAALAVSKCLDCCKMMCSACTQLHRLTKVTQKHSLVDVEVEEKDVACKTHDGELIRFYCEPCGACICVVCAFQEPHHGHDVSTFSEAIDRHRHALDSLLAECKHRADQLRKRLDRTGNWETQVRAAEQQVREAAMDCVMSVRQREKQLLAELRAVLCDDPSTRAFIADRSTVEATLRGLDSTCQLTDIIVRDRSVELLLLKDDIARRMTSLLQSSVAQAAAEAAAASKSVRFVATKKIKLGWLDFGNDNEASVCSRLERTEEDDVEEDRKDVREPELDYSAAKSSEPKRKRAIEIAHDFERMNSACSVSGYKTQDKTPIETAAIQRADKVTMTSGISMVNSETMTLEIPHSAAAAGFQFRLTESRSTTMSSEVFVENKQTATMSTVQVDRSTLTTRRPALCDKCTETTAVTDLAQTFSTKQQAERLQQQRQDEDEEQQPWWLAGESTGVQESTNSCNKPQQTTTTTTTTVATETDEPLNASKSTSTERPFQLDKIVSTPKIVQSTRDTNTPYVIYLDMAVDTAYIPGDDKACSTRVIVTTDSSTCTDDIDLLPPAATSRQRTSPRLTSRTADVMRRRNVSLDDVDEGRWSWRRSDEILQSAAGGDAVDDVDMTSSVTLTRSLQLTLPDQSATSCLHDRQDSGVVADVTSGQQEVLDVDRPGLYNGECCQWSRDEEITSRGENRKSAASSHQVPTINIDGRLDKDSVDVVQQQQRADEEFVSSVAIGNRDAKRTVSCSLQISPHVLQDSASNTESVPDSRTVDTSMYRPSVCHVDCNTELTTESRSTNTTTTTTTTTTNLPQPCTAASTNTAIYRHTDTNTEPPPRRQDSDTSTATNSDSSTSPLTIEQSSCSTNTGVDGSDVALPETTNAQTNTVLREHVSTNTPQCVYLVSQTNTATCRSAETNTAPLPVMRDVITSTPLSSDAATGTPRVEFGTAATNTCESRDAMTSTAPVAVTQSASTNTSQFSDSATSTVTMECLATATNTATGNDAETNTEARRPEVDASTCTAVFHSVSTCTAERLHSSSWTNTAALQATQTNTDSWLSCSDAATDMERLEDSGTNTPQVECRDKCTCTAVHVHQACNTLPRTQRTVETSTDTDQLESRTLADQSTDMDGVVEMEGVEKKEWRTVGTVTDVAGFDEDFDLEEIVRFYRQRLLCKPNDALTQTECFVNLVDCATGDEQIVGWVDCGYGEAFIDVVDRGCGDAVIDVEDDSWAQTTDVWTSTLRVTLADRATDMVERHMVSKNEATDTQDVADVGTSPADDVTSAYRCLVATYQRPTTFSRGTSTPAVPATVECGMLTDQTKFIDAGTSPNPDVTAIYRGRLVGGQHRVTVSRGTLTIQLKSADKETSCAMTSETTGSTTASVERGCSPVRFLGIDKSVSVNRGSLSEPVDVFVKSCNGSLEGFAAGRSSGPRPIHKRLSGSCPRMDSISEQADESSASSSSDGETTGSTCSLTVTSHLRKTPFLRPPFRPVLPARQSLDYLRRLPPSPATVTHTQRTERFCPSSGSRTTTFGVEGSSQASSIVCRVEVSTNTSSKTFEDKSVGTDCALSSSAVDGKMAECINKLRTVRQRLEQQQQSSPAGTPPRNVSPPDSTNSPQTASLNTSTSSSSSSPTRPEVDLRRLIAEKCAETPLLRRHCAASTPAAAADLASKPEQRGRTSLRHIDASSAFEQPTGRASKNRVGGLNKDTDVDQLSVTTSRTTAQRRHDELAELPSSTADSGRKNRLTRPTLFQQRSFSPRARQQRRRADDSRTNVSTSSSRPVSAETSSAGSNTLVQQTAATAPRNGQSRPLMDRPRSAVTLTKTSSLSEANEDQQTSPGVESTHVARKTTSGLSSIGSPQLLRRRRLPSAPDTPPRSRPSSGNGSSRTEQTTSTKSPGHGASFTSSIQIKGSSPRLGVRSTTTAAVRVNSGRRPAAAALMLLTEDELRSTTSDSDSMMTQSGSSDDVEPTKQQQQQEQEQESSVSVAASDKMLRSSLARKQRLDIKQLLTARSAASPTDRNIAAAAGAAGQQVDSRSPLAARRTSTRKYIN